MEVETRKHLVKLKPSKTYEQRTMVTALQHQYYPLDEHSLLRIINPEIYVCTWLWHVSTSGTYCKSVVEVSRMFLRIAVY